MGKSQSPFKALTALGKTLTTWKYEVARMWRVTKSNGITEDFHQKMKLIQRRAYGFKNFENYIVRVKAALRLIKASLLNGKEPETL